MHVGGNRSLFIIKLASAMSWLPNSKTSCSENNYTTIHMQQIFLNTTPQQLSSDIHHQSEIYNQSEIHNQSDIGLHHQSEVPVHQYALSIGYTSLYSGVDFKRNRHHQSSKRSLEMDLKIQQENTSD
jgi:hypothetical protein